MPSPNPIPILANIKNVNPAYEAMGVKIVNIDQIINPYPSTSLAPNLSER